MVDTAQERQTGAENVIWDLSVYYESVDDPRIDTDLSALGEEVGTFEATYRGKIASLSAEEMAEAYRQMEAIYAEAGKLYSFASLNFSVYSNDPQWGALIQKIQERYAEMTQRLVFFSLEWNAVPDEQAQALMDDPALVDYRYHMEVERLNKPYQLSEIEEQLLIEKAVTGNNAWTRLFDQITSSMMLEFDGKEYPMPVVLKKMYDTDREVRKAAADSVTAALQDKSMELTYIFNVLAADKASDDRRRGYPNWITPRNMSNKASDEVVAALIKTVTDNYDLVARHYNIKRALLGHDELYDYDRYAPLDLKESDAFYTWEEARQIVVSAYSGFSEELGQIADEFFTGQWIHAPMMPGKRGGAYASYGTPSTHPWVFVNFGGTANDIMTLAHELGHGVHMYLSNKHQTPFSRSTPLTTAETASVFGEMIVFQDLMSKESDKEVQLSMLAEKIEGTFATVYRQISMNRFEDAMHTARRNEGELSKERLSDLWMGTQQAMFEDSVTLRDDYALWWSYIPHFLHTPGYVYAYAFGELLVLALYNLYQERGADFVPQYLQLLSAGDSDYPENLLAQVGVDLNNPGFWQQGVEAMRKLVDQEEALAKELYPDKF